jgi:CheY-like chemotaxis protein
MRSHEANGRVLVVEDDPAVLEVMKEAFQAFGYEADGALTAREALDRLERADDYAALLVDIRLPDMNGQALSRHIASRYPSLARRIVLSTADILTGDALAFANDGRIRCLIKPFSLAELESALGTVRAGAA